MGDDNWDSWENSVPVTQDAAEDDDDEGLLGDDWEAWDDEEEEEKEGQEAQEGAAQAAAPKPKPKPKRDKRKEREEKERKRREKEAAEEVDAATKRRRDLLMNKVRDFENARGLMGADAVAPVSEQKPSNRKEYDTFINSMANVVTVWSHSPHYKDFLVDMLKQLNLDHELLSKLTQKANALKSEKKKTKTEESIQKSKYKAPKKDDMDVGLTAGGPRSDSYERGDEYDFM
eukprot:TRINITY_DN66518_c8_g4_i1.p1 TRINITY_DN66518_c8_g4~~TRINITY_DN66518_c8_g4_i1.p1  ORF type:complete len:242 (+),score=60.94 TRINITY_DN66518_c8_g4_i1:34-726(+)